MYNCILYVEYLPIKKDFAEKSVILHIITHPSDPLPPTFVQWCVALSRSAIGVVVVVIAATVFAAAAVAPSLPAAPPNRRLLRRRRHRSPPPLPPPTADRHQRIVGVINSPGGGHHRRHCRSFLDLFPANLEKKLCSLFCLHGKKCSKPSQVCGYEHIGKREKIPATDQIKILEHCHATQGKKIWLNANTFLKHKNTIPDKYTYLLRDSKVPKGA